MGMFMCLFLLKREDNEKEIFTRLEIRHCGDVRPELAATKVSVTNSSCRPKPRYHGPKNILQVCTRWWKQQQERSLW